MTIEATYIATISPFTVGASGTITAEQFTTLAAIAAARLESTYPGVPATMSVTLYDYCHGLMTCHLIEARRGVLELTSERYGEDATSKESGMSTYLLELQKTVVEYQTGRGATYNFRSRGVKRIDASVGNLKMDQADVPDFIDDNDIDTGSAGL